jgi:hypothetical protein
MVGLCLLGVLDLLGGGAHEMFWIWHLVKTVMTLLSDAIVMDYLLGFQD